MNRISQTAAACLAFLAGPALAFCPTPTRTGNPAYDNIAQQQFYMCLQQANRPTAPPTAYPQPSGQINFNQIDTSIPAQIGANTANSIAAMRQLQLQREQQQLQNEMMRLQIEQMQRQLNQP